MMTYLRFGTFIPPIHPVDENPTLCIERDMQTVQHLDALGYDEAWIGEHHSAGTELIASPELVLAVLGDRTKRIRLGTGVSSLPYHHPLILADRMMQLHHMTRGRAMMGAGPGALVSDAKALGITPERQRDMMDESLDVIMRLFRGETVTMKTDWFELNEARLQLKPYANEPIEIATASVFTPSGARSAGRFGTGLMAMGGTSSEGIAAATRNWDIATETGAKNGHTMARRDWRLVGLIHIAETREQVFANVRYGIDEWIQYFEDVATHPMVPPEGKGDPAEHLVGAGRAVIGDPSDAIQQIEKLQNETGGFGCYLLVDHAWARFEDKLKSYELFARHVMPHFQGHNTQRRDSYNWVRDSQDDFKGSARRAQQVIIDRQAAEEGEKSDAAD
jgi:limonene 1,2-monooxygenase